MKNKVHSCQIQVYRKTNLGSSYGWQNNSESNRENANISEAIQGGEK